MYVKQALVDVDSVVGLYHIMQYIVVLPLVLAMRCHQRGDRNAVEERSGRLSAAGAPCPLHLHGLWLKCQLQAEECLREADMQLYSSEHDDGFAMTYVMPHPLPSFPPDSIFPIGFRGM